jgi:hypothetical protein
MHCKKFDRPVKLLKFSFEFTRLLGIYRVVYFYGLFWGEQQPFVSSGYGGLYFYWHATPSGLWTLKPFAQRPLALETFRHDDRRHKYRPCNLSE